MSDGSTVSMVSSIDCSLLALTRNLADLEYREPQSIEVDHTLQIYICLLHVMSGWTSKKTPSASPFVSFQVKITLSRQTWLASSASWNDSDVTSTTFSDRRPVAIRGSVDDIVGQRQKIGCRVHMYVHGFTF